MEVTMHKIISLIIFYITFISTLAYATTNKEAETFFDRIIKVQKLNELKALHSRLIEKTKSFSLENETVVDKMKI